LLFNHPPPYQWIGSNYIYCRFISGKYFRIPLEIFQQFNWWITKLFNFRHKPANLPFPLYLWACWLNTYSPIEVLLWWRVGVRSPRELSVHCPNLQSWTVHAQRRLHWPEQCRPALCLLANKAALLAACPHPWRPSFDVLDITTFKKNEREHGRPVWWAQALEKSGLVLKPLAGHGGRAVLHFYADGDGWKQKALFRRLPAKAPPVCRATLEHPLALLAHWQHLCRTKESALATPYLTHSEELPESEPSVVVRVITAHDSVTAPITVALAWLEVPLGGGAVALINLEGQSLPCPDPPLSPAQRQSLLRWEDRLQAGVPSSIAACLVAAVQMHARLPPIDQVAWDWIPADPHPQLLEGNGSFGLLVPQLFAHLSLAARGIS
jgi:hypothetical protein